jgi:hypothetical protein
MDFENKKEYLATLWKSLAPHKKDISERDYKIMSSHINSTGIKKKGYDFTKEGTNCHRLGFLIKGDLYSHGVDVNGKKKVSHFYHHDDNLLVTNITSLDLDIVATESITALSDVVLLYVTLNGLTEIFKDFPYMYKIKSTANAFELNKSIQDNMDFREMEDFDWLENLYLSRPYLFFSPFKNHLENFCPFSPRSFDTHFKILKIKYKF